MGGHHHPVTGSCATYFVGIPLLVFWLKGLLVGAANSWLVGLPDISNNVGPVKLFLSALLHSLLRLVLLVFLDSASTTTARFVISRSASVRPKHLFDLYFDHDY